jgi:hypothetical protein
VQEVADRVVLTHLGEPPGAHVAHRASGPGTVTRVRDGVVTVAFDEAGYRTLEGSLAAAALSPRPDA